ncbi:hypothetical protein [Mucilaginibacter flavidus]|uniref:hypothetical protein n=1 Tax=Mucilaginibacter flavidus TaxID=2949309 RepID=UPI0020934037|nr:hypothetical protein [Mucilaginibacter flavidus]MCO5945369.1 hypothetical protein [Mucilaginibacter flavidus]
MDAIKFVEYFNLIKPDFEEIRQIIPPEIIIEIAKDFDLKVVSNDLYDAPIFDLIWNTNICDISFSKIHFKRRKTDNQLEQIGTIEELGTILFDKNTGLITFEELYDDMYGFDYHPINQTEFLEFYLKYLEMEFNEIFRKSPGAPKIIDDIKLDIAVIKKFPIFKALFFAWGIEFDA